MEPPSATWSGAHGKRRTVPTPGELNKIKAAVAEAAAALLARESNEETTAESLAEELADAVVSTVVDTYEEIQAKSYNLVVVAAFEPGKKIRDK